MVDEGATPAACAGVFMIACIHDKTCLLLAAPAEWRAHCVHHTPRSTFFQKIKSALAWTGMFLVILGIVIGILYGEPEPRWLLR